MVYQGQSFPSEGDVFPGFGVHLNLTSGKPILPAEDVTTFVDKDGTFIKSDIFFQDIEKINILQVEKEWRTQITAFLIKFGRPDHLDSHHHIHLHPLLFPLFLQIAGELRTPIRFPILLDMVPAITPEFNQNGLGQNISLDMIKEDMEIMKFSGIRTPDYFCDNFITPNIEKPEILKQIFHDLPEGITEIMCHPGSMDETARSFSNYPTREEELRTLQSDLLRPILEEENIQLTRFTTI